MASPEYVFTRHPNLEISWPFVHERMVSRLEELGVTLVLNTGSRDPIHEQIDLSETIGISHFGGNLTEACIAAAPKLKVLGAMTDNLGTVSRIKHFRHVASLSLNRHAHGRNL